MSLAGRALLLVLLLCGAARWAQADEFRPAYLQLTEVDAGTYDVLWEMRALSAETRHVTC